MMQIGVCLADPRSRTGGPVEPRLMIDLSRFAEDIGLDWLGFPDRVARPTPRFDTLTYLAAVATHTKRIRIKTHAFILPLRHPVETARRVLTLDHLSEGRFVFEVGLGGGRREPGRDNTVLDHEYRNVGISQKERGSRADEAIGAMISMWTNDRVTFHGRHYDLEGLELAPAPFSVPHPEIWVGGFSPFALRRAGRFGTGFSPLLKGVEPLGGVPAIRRRLAEEATAAGRSVERFHLACSFPATIAPTVREGVEEGRSFWNSQQGAIEGSQSWEQKADEGVYGPPELLVEELKRAEGMGIDSVIIHFHSYDIRSQLERLADAVLPGL